MGPELGGPEGPFPGPFCDTRVNKGANYVQRKLAVISKNGKMWRTILEVHSKDKREHRWQNSHKGKEGEKLF